MNPDAEQNKIINYFFKSSVYCKRILIIRDNPFFWIVISDNKIITNSNLNQKIFYPPKTLVKNLGNFHKKPYLHYLFTY